MVGKKLAEDLETAQQRKELGLATTGPVKAENFLQADQSESARGLSGVLLPRGVMERLLKEVPREPLDRVERLVWEIDKRCAELINTNRSSIVNLDDKKLKTLVERLKELVADRLGISHESLDLKFVQTNDGLALRGHIHLEGGLKLPVDICRDGILTFSKPFVLTEQGLVPQSLTNVKFKDDSVSVCLRHSAGARNAFSAVKYVTEQTKGREGVVALKEEDGVVYALAKDQVSRSFYVYKFETVNKEGKSEVVVSKERAKVEETKESGGTTIKVKNESREIVFRLGGSEVVFSSRTSETAEMLFADE